MLRSYVPWTAGAYIAGSAVAYTAELELLDIAIALTAAATLLLITRKQARMVLISACAIALLFGMMRVAWGNLADESEVLQIKEPVYIEGIVVGDVEHKNTTSRYVVRIENIRNTQKGEWLSLEKKSALLVYEQFPTRCVTGERVHFTAQLKEPEDFITETKRVFKYKKHLKQFNIHAITFLQKSNCKGEAEERDFFATMRRIFTEAMQKVLPTQEASLLSGLVLGMRSAFPPDLLEAFRITGLMHIIVLSGYNITLVAESVRRLLKRLPTAWSFALSLLSIVTFILLAGAQTAAIRAGSMATIALIARATRREHDGIRAMFLVAALMAAYNPDQVLFSTSFHLSFLATLGLLLFSPILEKKLRKIPNRLEIRNIIAATLATQIMLLPYLAYAIGEVSIIGIIANILILPIIPVAMAFGSIVTGVALIMPSFAILLMPLGYLPLHFMIVLAKLLSQVPYATLVLPKIPVGMVLIATAALAWIAQALQKDP